jgi:hypothetical protein
MVDILGLSGGVMGNKAIQLINACKPKNNGAVLCDSAQLSEVVPKAIQLASTDGDRWQQDLVNLNETIADGHLHEIHCIDLAIQVHHHLLMTKPTDKNPTLLMVDLEHVALVKQFLSNPDQIAARLLDLLCKERGSTLFWVTHPNPALTTSHSLNDWLNREELDPLFNRSPLNQYFPRTKHPRKNKSVIDLFTGK